MKTIYTGHEIDPITLEPPPLSDPFRATDCWEIIGDDLEPVVYVFGKAEATRICEELTERS